MKYRMDFITNSSSSSFTIQRKNLTANQIEAIRLHGILGALLDQELETDTEIEFDAWDIGVDGDSIHGFTIVDNFNMGLFFDKIGVDRRHVEWELVGGAGYEKPFPADMAENWEKMLAKVKMDNSFGRAT
jgi:hypothetical protein